MLDLTYGHGSDGALTFHDRQTKRRDIEFGSGSSVECTSVDMACLCCLSSVPKLIALLFAVIRRPNMRRICQLLCKILMGSRYRTWFITSSPPPSV